MNIVQPPSDEEVLYAIVRLIENQDFQKYQSWLADLRYRQHEENARERDDVDLRIGQGASQVLQVLVEVPREARAALTAYQKQRAQQGAMRTLGR